MEFIGKRVKHVKDGFGTITDFYTTSKRFNVKFDSGVERPYEYPASFDNSVLSTDDQELNDQIEHDLMISKSNVTTYNFNNKQFYGQYDDKQSPAPFIDPLTAISLIKGYSYGETAYKIYQALCKNEAFGWASEHKGRFSQQQHLYAQHATREGYAVWFLAYSSYTMTKSKTRGITNNLELKTNNIEEVWDNAATEPPVDEENEITITFVKNRQGQYEFWGVMRKKEINKTQWPFRVYSEFVSKEYVPGTQY